MLEIFDFHYENLSVGSRYKQFKILPIQTKWIQMMSNMTSCQKLQQKLQIFIFYAIAHAVNFCLTALKVWYTRIDLYEKLKPAKTETTVELAITIFHSVQLAFFNLSVMPLNRHCIFSRKDVSCE